jgi:hypothetical protein
MSVREQLDEIKRLRENPLPTPPIGERLQWFEANQDDRCYAAVCTRQEAAGKIEIAIFKPRHTVIHKQGVWHRSHPVHQNRHNNVTVNNGSWDYLPGTVIPKSHRDRYLRELDQRQHNILESERVREAALQAQANIQMANTIT